MDKVIVIHTLSGFGQRFRVPKICQSKLRHSGMSLMGEVLILEGLLLMSLQVVEKFIELRIFFALIVNRSPRDTQVSC